MPKSQEQRPTFNFDEILRESSEEQAAIHRGRFEERVVQD